MTTPKKIELGTLYIAHPTEGSVVLNVRPANGKEFTLEEWQLAVGGFVETMLPAVKWRRVFVNEEGTLKNLPLNRRTWEFADRHAYVDLNFYAPDWLVHSNALEVRRVAVDSIEAIRPYLTIVQALRTLEVKP